MIQGIMVRWMDALIRKIQPFLVLLLPILCLFPEHRLFSVLVAKIPPDEQEVDETCSPAADNRHSRRYISWRVIGTERLRSWWRRLIDQLLVIKAKLKKAYVPIIFPTQ